MTTTVIAPTDGPISLPFTDNELTASINILPATFGQMTAEGLFPNDPLTSQYFTININNDVITALPVTDGGPATLARHGTQEERIFRVPGIDHQDDVMADDIRGWMALFERTRTPETLATLMNKRLTTFRKKFDITLEVMKQSALKGVVVDGAGNPIIDLFAAFDLTKKIVYFNFADDNADIQGACDLVYQLITQDLSDEVMTTVEARVSRQFFNLLVNHPNVNKFWLQAEQALALANIGRGTDGSFRPRQFTFGNITFKENSAVVPLWGGSPTALIAASKGHAYPAGTMDTHVTHVAPPKDIRVLNGEPANLADMIHLTTEPMKHGKGVEMLGQMNALPIWRRPKLLVELDSGAGASTAPLG